MQRILIFRPDEIVYERIVHGAIDEDLMFEGLGGNAEEVPWLDQFEKMNIVFLQNERAKLMKLEPTIRVVKNGILVDVICGNVLAVGIDEDSYVGLKPFQVDYIMENIKTAVISLGHLVCIPVLFLFITQIVVFITEFVYNTEIKSLRIRRMKVWAGINVLHVELRWVAFCLMENV